MTDRPVQQALEASAIEVLEKMFFVTAVPVDAAPAAALSIHVEFEGEPEGRLALQLEARAADAIAANFLGEDASSLGPGKAAEVACELANMVCGAVLSRLESTAAFRLAPPRLLADEAWPHGPAVSLDTGDGLLALCIETECPICPAPAKSAF